MGLITNPSGVDGRLVPTADRLARDGRFELVQLYGPEHGIRGDVYAGDAVADGLDPVTGVPVRSLYGDSKRPDAESLARLDVLLFDIQDLGSRTYTYVSTLGEAMVAAAEAGVRFVVLDRPNPIGGDRFEGPVRLEEWQSFIGWGPIPITHGMTAGELARLYEGELGLGCELEVVPMAGWERWMRWEDTGLTWVQTSPHIPHAVNAHLYVATGMVGGVSSNVNEGVGYTFPFEALAAEFIDPLPFAAALAERGLPGLRFVPTAYRPFYGGHEGLALRGVRLVLDDPRALRPVRTALTLMTVLEELYPGQTHYREGRPFNIHWGDPQVLELLRAGAGVDALEASWAEGLERFGAVRDRYLLY